MISHSTPTWSYQIMSETLVRFYHVLLPQTKIKKLFDYLPHVQEIAPQSDGGISISFSSGSFLPLGLQKLIAFFAEQEGALECPTYTYDIHPNTRKRLVEWFLSYEGCIAMLLVEDESLKPFLGDWSYINESTGGIQVGEYKIAFYNKHPKVISPLSLENYHMRNILEQKTARFALGLAKRMEEAQAGFEGLALQSFVCQKTSHPPKVISDTIYEKSAAAQTPVQSPFFSAAL